MIKSLSNIYLDGWLRSQKPIPKNPSEVNKNKALARVPWVRFVEKCYRLRIVNESSLLEDTRSQHCRFKVNLLTYFFYLWSDPGKTIAKLLVTYPQYISLTNFYLGLFISQNFGHFWAHTEISVRVQRFKTWLKRLNWRDSIMIYFNQF